MHVQSTASTAIAVFAMQNVIAVQDETVSD
jgi:hypothetical protein